MSELTARKNLREELERLVLASSLENPVIVSRQTLRIALQRFLARELEVDDLVGWANLLEGYELIGYEPGFEKQIADVVFRISTPEINAPLNHESCQDLLSQLSL